MLKKLKFAAVALLLPLLAFAQSYPSPTFNNVTVQGTLTAASQSFTSPLPVSSGGTGIATLTGLALGNGTSAFSAYTGTSCTNQFPRSLNASGVATCASVANADLAGSIAASKLIGTDIATVGTITAGTWNGTTIAVANGGTGLSTIAAHNVVVGNGASNISLIGPGVAGTALISQGASSFPTFGYPTGTLIGFQRFTSSGTYTPSAGTNSVIAECLGGGGAGGGAAATGAGQISVGGGGNAGAYAVGRFTSGYSGITVTIGSAGVGSSGAVGGTGGTSSFGALMTANGGVGGQIGAGATTTPTISLPSGTVATASGGSIANISGSFGEYGESISAALNIGGKGASSQYGAGGYPGVNGGVATAANGFGAGGGGAALSASTAAQAGGNGAPGVCIVYEYN